MLCPARVCCVLVLLISLVSAQEAKHCRFHTEYDTRGDESGRSERLLNQDISECKTLCLSESSCVAVEFEQLSSTCYSYSADTSKTSVKGFTFLTKVCLTHDPASTVSPDLSASSVAGLDATDAITPEIPLATATPSLLDVMTTVLGPSSNSSDNTTDSPILDLTDSANATGSNVSASGVDVAASIDPSIAAVSTATGSTSPVLADSLGASGSISKSPDASASVEIIPTSTMAAVTPSTASLAGASTPALGPSPTTIVTTQKTTVKADIPDSPVKTTDSPSAKKTPTADKKPPTADSKTPKADPKSAVTDVKSPPLVGSGPNPGVPSNGSYPYPYPYPPYPYPYPPYPPYPYPGYPPYPPARYPNPFPVPQPQPQPQIPIYQLPKSTDPPITINRRTNRLCFNRNKFPDLKLPEEKPKFFLIPSGSDGKFSVVSVPSRYNPVVCFPVSYRGNVPILHLPSANTPSNPYAPGVPQQNPFPLGSLPGLAGLGGLAGQSPGGQTYFQNQDGTIGVPIDIGKFLKEYGQGELATTSPQTTKASVTPAAGETDTASNRTDAVIGNATDIGSDALNSSLSDINVNGTEVNNMTIANGTEIDANATHEFYSNSTNNAVDNSTLSLNETESMGNMTSFNSSFVDGNMTDIIQHNMTDATTPSTTIATMPPITRLPQKKPGYGGPGPLRPGRWSNRRRGYSRRDRKGRRRPRPRPDRVTRYKGKHPSRIAQRHYLRRKKLSSRRNRAPTWSQPPSHQISPEKLRRRIDLRAKSLQ